MLRAAGLLFVLLLAPAHAEGAPAEIVRGIVDAAQPCTPAGYAVTVSGAVLVNKMASSTLALPVPGQRVLAVVSGTTTCASAQAPLVGKTVSRISFSYPPQDPGPVGSARQSPSAGSTSGPGGGLLQQLGSQIGSYLTGQAKKYLNQVLQPVAQGQSGQQGQQQGAQGQQQDQGTPAPAQSGGTPVPTSPQPTALPFGGPINSIRFCSNGAIWVTLGPPTPGPYVWMPGTKSYLHGPPATVGQHLLGLSGPSGSGVCIIGTSALIGSRIIMHGSSGPISAVQPPQQGTPRATPVSDTRGTGTPQCTDGSNIKFKPGAGRELKTDIASNLAQFCDAAGDLDWQVTEGCPATRVHVNECHANCTCVDIGFQSRQYTADKVQRALDAGESVGSRLVFESNNKVLIDELRAAGVPADQAKYYPSCSTGSRPCVTGSHFSYYCPTCKR